MDFYQHRGRYVFKYNRNVQNSQAKTNITSDAYEESSAVWYDEEKGDQNDRNRNVRKAETKLELFSQHPSPLHNRHGHEPKQA